MTTSWANLVRGRLTAALAASAAGTLLGWATIVAVVWLSVSAALGRWVVRPPGTDASAWLLLSLTAVMLIEWVVRVSAAMR